MPVTGELDLSSNDFWSASLASRHAAFARLREREAPPYFSTAMNSNGGVYFNVGIGTDNVPEDKVDVGRMKVTNQPVGNRKPEPKRRNPRVRSRSAAAQSNRAGATVRAKEAVVHNKRAPARSRSKPTSARTDLGAGSVSSADAPPASTKRATLIAMLERPEGALVAEIGERLGWLPHTVRAAITGLRKAGREVSRSKDADNLSVYRLGPVEPASQR